MRPSIVVLSNCYPNQHKQYACMFVKRHVQLHRQAGLDVTVLTTGDSRQGTLRSLWKYLVLLGKVLWLALFKRVDLVHAHWPFPAGVYGLLLSRLRGKPFVVTSHGAFVDNLAQYPRLVSSLVVRVLRGADVLIVVSQDHAKRVADLSGVPIGSMHKIDMGAWLPDNVPDKSAAREILGLPQNERQVLFVGNLIPRKGADLLVEAVSRLKEHERQSTRVIIAGQGGERERLLAAIKQYGLEEIVHLVGPVPHDDVYTWFSAADICVMPSRTEPFGLVALEAMWCDSAVVASETGGLKENIQNEQNGLLFPPDDVARLTEQLSRLLNDDALRARITRAGRKTAASFDTRLRAEQVKDIYETLLGSPLVPTWQESESGRA